MIPVHGFIGIPLCSENVGKTIPDRPPRMFAVLFSDTEGIACFDNIIFFEFRSILSLQSPGEMEPMTIEF